MSALGAGPAEAVAAVSAAFRAAPAGDYPNVAALAESIVVDDMEQTFLFGIERIIEGLRGLLVGGGSGA